ncbi:hypothetical protein QYF36_022900 [Acer negundo]|nr:hypothetical protein QYF36_022900 [Acer negundo]
MMKGKESRKGTSDDDGFFDTLFSWSLQDIFNKNLFKHKVQKIPESFHSLQEYFGSYVFPLLEETRTQLCSSMNTIARAPFARIVYFEENKPRKNLYNVTVGEWRNVFSNRGKEPYKTLPGDILILADAKPESASDLQRVGRMWTFLLVKKIPEDDDENENEIGSTSTYFEVQSAKDIQLDDEKMKSMFVIFLTNVIPNRNIWNSLGMSGNLMIFKEVLSIDPGVEENCEQCCMQSKGIRNDSQVKAISACLSKMHCDHKSSVDLICGPPGTGKTKTEVASRVLKVVKESYGADSRRNNLFCPLGDILLFGNKDRLKVGAETEEIFMDYRIERLQECFVQLTCWRHRFTSMIDFLQDCVPQYHIFLGNETDGNKREIKSFLQFVRERFKHTASSLRNCLLLFLTHIPENSYNLHTVDLEPLYFLVIDEAAQLKESESTIPLKLMGIKHAILIGDECQLPAMVESSVSDEAGFGRSLYQRLSSLGHKKHLLNIQYRMHPSISFFPNSKFYHNQILDGPNVTSKSYEQCYLPGGMFGPYSFINILGGREELDEVGHSRRNMVEVSVVMNILQNLFKVHNIRSPNITSLLYNDMNTNIPVELMGNLHNAAWICSKKKLSIDVVSPYKAQVVAIQQQLGHMYENRNGFVVKVKSVDGFQGVRDAKDRQCFFNVDEDKDLARAILEVKREYDKFDVLHNAERIPFGSQRRKRNIGVGRRSEEIHKTEQGFREGCSYEIKDNKSMKKFVKAFDSMDLRHNSLKSLNCFDELLLLEEESGNFLDASSIAKQRGDILLAADLLQKAGNFKEASSLTLNYVFFNSLWFHGSKGWPLKQFSKKEELLERAKSLAKSDSNQFYEFVCMEAEILSNDQANLCRINFQFNASKIHKSIRGEILFARKILDVHLHSNTFEYEWEDELVLDPVMFSEEKVSKSKVSIETLVYFWNYWKEKIVNILEYLGRLETQDVNDYQSYGDFCLNYLGVWKPDAVQYKNLGNFYLLLNSDADWVRELNNRYAQRRGKLPSIDVSLLVSAAQGYWNSELFSVGTEVLFNLEALYKHSVKSSKSMFCQFSSLAFIFDIAKFLLDAKFLCNRQHDVKELQKFVELPIKEFFGYVFPLDWRESSKKKMISLRGREVCKRILVEVISKCIGLKNKLSYGQIGSVAVMILGSGELHNELLEQVAKRCDGTSPWKAFLESLQGNMGSESEQGSAPCDKENELREVSLVQKFHGALLDTYGVKWRKTHDYISPACFLYLIERLLIMLSCFRGYFLTTKSSFVDWLVHLDGKTDPTPFLQTNVQQSMGHILEFIVHIVQQLLHNKEDTVEWIRRCHNTNVKDYHSLVAVLVCLLHLNFRKCINAPLELLCVNYIANQLPQEFCDVLYRGRKHNYLNVNANMIAEAFIKIGNPLVIVSLGENCSKFMCPDAIFVDMKVSRCKEDILGILFPKVESTGATTLEATNLYREELPTDLCDKGKSSNVSSSASASLTDQYMNTQKTNDGNLVMNPGNIWKMFESLNLVDNGNDQKSMKLNATTIKADVQKICCHLIAATNGLIRKKLFVSEDENQLDEAADMLEELMQLYATLDVSEPELINNTSTVGELSMRLQSRRLTMEPFLNELFLQQCKGKESESDIASGGNCDEGKNDSKGKASTSSATNASTTKGSSNQETKSKGMTQNKFNKSIWRKRGQEHK